MQPTDSWKSEITINRSSVRPLYLQVKEALQEWISNGLHDSTLSPGDRMPSENELSEMLQVSPITIKRALDDLRRQGLIQRIQGRGSFIAGQKKMVLPLKRLFNLTALTLEQGMTPNRQTVELTEMNASSRVARRLSVSESAHVARLVRVRLMDRTPFAVETTYLPMHLFPNFLSEYHDRISLYELLLQKYGQEPVSSEDILEPALINPFESKLLEIPVGSLGTLFDRTAYNRKNEPLEFTKTIFRGDLCCFSIDMVKENDERKSPAE
jgi:GntR family transcriptional regulator